MKICIIIPVYNESQTIGELIKEIKNKSLEVVVIDDGSTDCCGDIAEQNGAHLIRHQEKKGKGVSLRDGFDYVAKKGFDAVITMDGDGQHDIVDLDVFIEKANDSSGDIIVSGNRMGNCKNMPTVRFLTNKFMSAMISGLCHQKIPDSQCGFRFISVNILKAIQLFSSDFEIETEVLVRASRKGFKIYSVPIQAIYRNELSKINPFLDTIRFFAFIIKELKNSKS